ncbi:hypothetical protein [Paracoccus alkanivorans]|nr:hypothetical protein [Paracoccus alkanivorans]
MLRLFRIMMFAVMAFIAGILTERSLQKDRCLDLGGSWDKTGICDRG